MPGSLTANEAAIIQRDRRERAVLSTPPSCFQLVQDTNSHGTGLLIRTRLPVPAMICSFLAISSTTSASRPSWLLRESYERISRSSAAHISKSRLRIVVGVGACVQLLCAKRSLIVSARRRMLLLDEVTDQQPFPAQYAVVILPNFSKSRTSDP